jgi:F-type H+-transporting ATPase subunit delta
MTMAESSPGTSFDRSRERLGSIYAKGLLGAAEAQHLTDRVLAELDSLIDDVLSRLEKFEQFLASPRIRVEEKTRILDLVFASRMTPLFLNFLKVVARHGRLDCLRQIRTSAKRQYSELLGRVEVTVKTATPLTDQLRRRIEQRLVAVLGKQVDLRCTVNPELLGGLQVRVGDTVFDGSLDNRLDKMQAETLHRATQLIRDSLQRFLITE